MVRNAVLVSVMVAAVAAIAAPFEQDVLPTTAGDLTITFVGHGTLILAVDGTVIHVDPYSRLADYDTLPKADLVLVTHGHGDHLDPPAIAAVRKESTVVIADPASAATLDGARALANGESATVGAIAILAVPAYNLLHRRASGAPYHPRGEGNGYVLAFGGIRVYIAGDTENTPEMKALENIDVAFLPMNLPYTMTPEMVADAARAFRPRILYPYHYGDTDPNRVVELLRDLDGTEVRVRPMR